MDPKQSLFDAWIARLKNNPIVAAIMICAAAVGGIAALITGVETIKSTMSGDTPRVEAPPHAAPLPTTFGQLYDPQTILLAINSGEKKTLKLMELWSAPTGAPASCATAFVVFTWAVRDPFPDGREEIELYNVIPRGGGRTEQFAKGAEGAGSLGMCNELTFFNTSLRSYRVELRYGSGFSESHGGR